VIVINQQLEWEWELDELIDVCTHHCSNTHAHTHMHMYIPQVLVDDLLVHMGILPPVPTYARGILPHPNPPHSNPTLSPS